MDFIKIRKSLTRHSSGRAKSRPPLNLLFYSSSIAILENAGIVRKRFTVGHELGHLLLDFTDATPEKLCHTFAGALLLPKENMITDGPACCSRTNHQFQQSGRTPEHIAD
jgi:hypothetical protein